MKILITGANGYIGSLLALALADEHDVVGLVRRVPDRAVETLTFRTVSGINQVQPSDLQDVECVIHTAGIADAGGEASDLQRVNVGGSRALATACLESGVRQVIHLSSVKAAGEGNVGPDCLNQPFFAYGQSKLAAEQAFEEVLAGSAIQLCHVRFPLVYGEGVENNFKQLVRLARSRWPLPIGDLSAKRSYCCVETLVSLIQELIGSGEASGVLYVADPQAFTLPEMISEIARHSGNSSRIVKFPESLLRLAVKLLKPGYFNQLFTDAVVDASETKKRFPDWEPVSYKEALRFLKII
jgi:nucleoside-diphosphate-sugar epimerase